MNNGAFNIEVSLLLNRFLINKKLISEIYREANVRLNGYKNKIFQLMSLKWESI